MACSRPRAPGAGRALTRGAPAQEVTEIGLEDGGVRVCGVGGREVQVLTHRVQRLQFADEPAEGAGETMGLTMLDKTMGLSMSEVSFGDLSLSMRDTRAPPAAARLHTPFSDDGAWQHRCAAPRPPPRSLCAS
jgi:hypothetical protein